MGNKLRNFLIMLIIVAMVCTGCSSAQQKGSKAEEIADGITVPSDTETTASGTTENAGSDTEVSDIATAENLSASAVEVNTEFTANDLEVGYEDSTATHITLAESKIDVSGDGASADNGTVTIKNEGTYVITGTLSNGQLLVDAGDKDKIHIILKGATINNTESAPIYIKNADKIFLTLEEGTENILTDGTEYQQTDDNNVDGVIFSTADLTINGKGSLKITANYKHGIVSKDDLILTGGNITVNAVKDAMNGKDCVKIKEGYFNLTSISGDGIESKNSDDNTKGYVYIGGGTITLDSEEGIEGTVISIAGGTVNIKAKDDGLNASSGSSSNTLEKNQRDMLPDATSGASENTNMPGEFTGVSANQSDSLPPDIQNPDAASPSRPEHGGFGGGGAFENDTNCLISITGGSITVDALGDGIDSNGSLSVTGGNIIVSGPEENGNGSIDYNGTAVITGGIVMVAGSSGMAQGFSDTSTQYSILYSLEAVSKAGTEVKLTDSKGTVIAAYTPIRQYQTVVISTPELTKDETYTLTSGEQKAEIKLTDVVTSNVQQGMNGQRGPGAISTNDRVRLK